MLMKVGSNERIILSILKQYPSISDSQLKFVFQHVSHKRIKFHQTMRRLRGKKLVDRKRNKIIASNFSLPQSVTDDYVARLLSDVTIESSVPHLRLGGKEKKILVILSKVEKMSFQFLSSILDEKPENIFPVIKRLEEKGLVVGYESPIRHKNARGRWFRPKNYGLTDSGKYASATKLGGFNLDPKLNKVLSHTSNDLEQLKTAFYGTLNIR